jgi:hypothetical protein
MRGERGAVQHSGRSASASLPISLVLALLCLFPVSAPASDEEKDSCVACHSDRDFLVTNKKLYDYFQDWNASVHKQEEVSCSDCHGGNPEIADKDGAHGGKLAGAEVSSAVNFRNVPGTCGECHAKIYDAYRRSDHFEHLEKVEDEEQGPNCVTCHGSINVGVLDVNTVHESCARCHNDEKDNHPENPDRATAILNKFLSIHRFYRYITVRGTPEEAKRFFEEIDDQIESLSVTWHTFDLDEIEEATKIVLDSMKAERDKVRAALPGADGSDGTDGHPGAPKGPRR